MPRAAIVGNLVLDEVAGAPPRPGGAVWYCAHALHRLDPQADVVLACRCAPDDRATFLPALQRLGYPVVWHPSATTTRFAFHYEGDRRIMRLLASGDPWAPSDVTGWLGDALGDAAWVLVGALTRTDFPLETVTALADRGHRLVVDAQGLVRHGTPGPLVSDGDVPRALLDRVTVLKLNDEEADLLCGGHDAEHLTPLAVPEVVLTLGSRGSLILADGDAARVEPVPVDGPTDPTGAGDAYLVAYLSARLRGAGPSEAGTQASSFVSTLIAR